MSKRIAFRNFLDTITSFIRNDATVARVYQLQDRDGTLADMQDIEKISDVSITGAVALDDTAFGKLHVLSGVAADYTVTLPSAVDNHGKMIAFKCESDLSLLDQVITIDGNGTEKIDTRDNYKLAAGGYMTLVAVDKEGVGSWNILAFDQGAFISFDINYTAGTSGGTHFSSYKISGRTMFLRLRPTAHGTGAGTTLVFDLPDGWVAGTTARVIFASGQNNGATMSTPPVGDLSNGSASVTCYSTPGLAAWTGTGGRSITGNVFFEVK